MTTYTDAIKNIDTVTAMSLSGLSTEQQGSYIYYVCPACEGRAVAKVWGDKKNLTFCTKCKKAGHIISLAMDIKKMEYKDAVVLLKKAEKKVKPITEEINLDYELLYTEYLKSQGITEETAAKYHIGQPKGKTMLAGCTAYSVWNAEGTRIAYFGIRLKDEKPTHHSSFNPELYLYLYHLIDPKKETAVTMSMINCLKLWQEGKQAVCNFGLPYLSHTQMELLNTIEYLYVDVPTEQRKQFLLQAESLKIWHKFI